MKAAQLAEYVKAAMQATNIGLEVKVNGPNELALGANPDGSLGIKLIGLADGEWTADYPKYDPATGGWEVVELGRGPAHDIVGKVLAEIVFEMASGVVAMCVAGDHVIERLPEVDPNMTMTGRILVDADKVTNIARVLSECKDALTEADGALGEVAGWKLDTDEFWAKNKGLGWKAAHSVKSALMECEYLVLSAASSGQDEPEVV